MNLEDLDSKGNQLMVFVVSHDRKKVDNNSLIDTWLPYKKRMFQS